jgi:REP-associated tyrosine transposase
MTYDPAKHHRRSIRLRGYDYAQTGCYFVTLCTQGHICLLGDVVNEQMEPNPAGRMVSKAWDLLPDHCPRMEIDAHVVMPNHIHAVIVLLPPDDEGILSLADVVRRFKTFTTRRYTVGVRRYGWLPFAGRLWQRNYHEHIIRNERSLNKIRQYIADNPA